MVATGRRGHLPDVDGIGLPRVHEIREWLRTGAPDLGDEQHVVWGADREGVAVADDLLARGKRVLVIGAQDSLAPDVGRRAKILTVPRLNEDETAEIVLDTRIVGISADQLELWADGERRTIAGAGPVLVSQGLASASDPGEALMVAGFRGPVHLVGDAGGTGGDMDNAIKAGSDAAEWLSHELVT